MQDKLPAPAEVGTALVRFGNYRVLRTQQLAEKTFVHPSIIMALGFRETALRNIDGGAVWREGRWVQAYTDRGCFQISDQIPANAKWLESQEGCPEGLWAPIPNKPQHNALTQHFAPRFSFALEYTLKEMVATRRQALEHGVEEKDLVQFCVAAHNAGFTGALEGYRVRDIDLHTAHGDYSKWVLLVAPMIHEWVEEHPNWKYTGQPLSEEDEPVTDETGAAVTTAVEDAGAAVEAAVAGNTTAALSTGSELLAVAPAAISEGRRGYKTTEFWSTVVAALYATLTSAPVHDKAYVGILAAVYAVARGIAKAGGPPTTN